MSFVVAKVVFIIDVVVFDVIDVVVFVVVLDGWMSTGVDMMLGEISFVIVVMVLFVVFVIYVAVFVDE